MTYDTNMLRYGRCGNCKMKGLLLSKQMVRPIDVSSLNPANATDEPIQLPTMFVCLTCNETPAGIESPNLQHQRLPAAEYLVK